MSPDGVPTYGDRARARVVADRLKGEDAIRGFHNRNEAWYNIPPNSPHPLPEVTFGLYCKDGGCLGEMAVEWKNIGKTIPVPRLMVFDDAWEVLSSFADVIEAMAAKDDMNITQKEFCELLLRNGFTDRTAYERKG